MFFLAILLILAAAFVTAVVILSFITPQHSQSSFWQAVHRVRDALDKIVYYAMCTMAVCCVCVPVLWGILSAIGKSAGESISTVISNFAVMAVIILLVGICIHNLIREHKRGEHCECCGDCERCKIKCTSNPKYYGSQKSENNL